MAWPGKFYQKEKKEKARALKKVAATFLLRRVLAKLDPWFSLREVQRPSAGFSPGRVPGMDGEQQHTHWGRHGREFLDSKHGGDREVRIAQEQDGSIALKKQSLACQERRGLEEAKRIHARVKASAYRNDRYIANLLMDMFGACGSADTALEIFEKIQAPNIFSWNIILKVVTQKNGCDPEVWKIFEKIPEKEKNAVSWNIVPRSRPRRGICAKWRSFSTRGCPSRMCSPGLRCSMPT
ncbi:uncharacterized protein LOC9634162 [Selaginella moellendorffii]|uniref:uncharacterized protein LOC9634162 n=1 Tax=Selaginella moellendorffii TaxID=88036 RepID=UPI000D1CB21C|nr:uncharacterized protein LOC9634162 [Selaginella moellendorffii]XP_024540400.1 uncharacterized protein LOC9634162 [Selaginella moellendorffii]XP_024540401.1 uncharacterized protein LOC9634162 [Selaginella moellendorffii]|eukprot:XP_024540399.1 uncharacterized protein LOC9634162 [Selaginella moellendorffii]